MVFVLRTTMMKGKELNDWRKSALLYCKGREKKNLGQVAKR